MGLVKISRVVFLICVFSLLFFKAHSDCSEVSVKFLKTPCAFSKMNSASFAFEGLVDGNGIAGPNFSFSCKLDNGNASCCKAGNVSYGSLKDGNHTFEVCTNGLQEVGCATYNWTIDTVPPTAYIMVSNFTNSSNISVNISFSEPCIGGGGFNCSSMNACNLLVYGHGQVIPTSLNVLQQDLKYSLVVSLSSNVQRGRVILAMDKNFCTDNAGNRFIRTENSTFIVHFDRGNVSTNMSLLIPEMALQLNGETRIVQATNNYDNLKAYLNFSAPVLNSSAEILNSLNISEGSLLPINESTLGNSRFSFQVANVSPVAVVTVIVNSSLIISRQGTPFSPILNVTFLYDSQRPSVKLSTSKKRTGEDRIPILIEFMKPVFGFNPSSVSVSGGRVQSFHEINMSAYTLEIQAIGDTVSINVPENATRDVAGNKNLASNVLLVWHCSTPMISSVISVFATASFAVTFLTAGILTFSTASVHTLWSYATPPLTTNPAGNLFRLAGHIQLFALSRWLSVRLPNEYYEFARRLQWSIPSFSLPWETGSSRPLMVESTPSTTSKSYISKIYNSEYFQSMQEQEDNLKTTNSVPRRPLLRTEYIKYFVNQNNKPEAEYQNSSGWEDFSRIMFWLGVIGGSLILLHVLVLFILKLRKKSSENRRNYGALTFPRFEIFLIIYALPSICKASATLVKGTLRGEESPGFIVGIVLLGLMCFLLLSLFLFLSVGITFGKLLQYEEVHQEGRRFHWYQEFVRVTLGPGKRGQWTWKNQASSVCQIILGALFEDLRGPPKYMLSQISGGNPRKPGGRIIASDDETEDAEAPFIQKLFGMLRIYYTLFECLRRVSLGVLDGFYLENWSSTTPSIILLCISSFLLFFLVLKKPFINKKVQLVEIISVSTEVCLFATSVFLLKKKNSDGDETKVGIFMIILFLIGYIAQMINGLYALYRQTVLLDPAEKSFLTGLKIASVGCILIFMPDEMIESLEKRFLVSQNGQGESGDAGIPAERCKNSSSSSDKPGPKQSSEITKASFSKERNTTSSDPSTSRSKWSGFWSTKRGGSPSVSLSADSK